MCIIIIIIYTYNINSMSHLRDYIKKKPNRDHHIPFGLSAALHPFAADLPPTQAPFPGGGKLENPKNPKKTGRGHKKKPEPKHLAPRRKKTGQSKKKNGQPNNSSYNQNQISKPFEYENNEQTNNQLRKLQQNAIMNDYEFAALPRVHVPSVAETGQPTQQDYNEVASSLQENLQQPVLSSPQQGERSYFDNMNNALSQTQMRSNLGMDINSKYDNTLPARFEGKLGDLGNLGNYSRRGGGKRKKRTVKKKKVKKVNGKKITSGNKTQKKR